jgi:hypothetical protein
MRALSLSNLSRLLFHMGFLPNNNDHTPPILTKLSRNPFCTE